MSSDITLVTSISISGPVGVCSIGSTIYATCFNNSLLYIIDTTNNYSYITYDLGAAGCTNPFFTTQDGTSVYIAGCGSNNIAVYDPISNTATLIPIIPIPGNNSITPVALYLNSEYLYVTLINCDTVIEINLVTTIQTPVATITRPYGITYNDGIYYVVAETKVVSYFSDWTLSNDNLISAIDPTGITCFNNYLFLSIAGTSTVTQYTLTGELVGTFEGSIERPNQTTFDTSVSPSIYASAIYSDSILNIYNFTNITCFNKGTKILCLNKNFEEEYISIENLRKGDLVKSYLHGYRKLAEIGTRNMFNNPNKMTENMFKMEKTEENGLIEDLIITGGHSILVDKLSEEETYKQSAYYWCMDEKIDDKFLVLAGISSLFKSIPDLDMYSYYHFTLENNGDDDQRFGVYANGLLAETPSKKFYETMNFI